ncbi:unnamed protein product [Microthlaspi erraticum]|uniref:DUF7903 domain-containing protein n=1 Tax=Microthlaspi erraticum TaxID=1685480 RepID=A0A6D2KGD8_9BRAS|nr:unnamed protein product [Microthlaspi erraticum]
MSYIPPHKRNLKDPVRPSPVPDSLVPKFKKNIDFKSSSDKGNAIVHSGDFISKWFLIGSNGIEDEVPPYVKLVPLSSDSSERIDGVKSLVLMNNDLQRVNITTESRKEEKEKEEEERTRWLLLAERVEEDLVLAYEQAKRAMEDPHLLDSAKLRLVARFGKMIFYGRQAGGPVAEYSLEKTKRIFSTDVPTSFIQNIKSKAIPSHKFCIGEFKETYIVKALLNPVRYLVVNVSCLDKNLDMRLMLAGKRKIMALTEKEMSKIQELLDSATVDPNVKGRLRWPIRKTSSEYRILEVCHVKSTIYKNQTLRLRVRDTDRFNERYGTGEIERGVTLILQSVNTMLQEKDIERGCVMEMLRDVLGTIWDFFRCDAN